MMFLFVFAHPDDETIACAGTTHKLIQLITLVSRLLLP